MRWLLLLFCLRHFLFAAAYYAVMLLFHTQQAAATLRVCPHHPIITNWMIIRWTCCFCLSSFQACLPPAPSPTTFCFSFPAFACLFLLFSLLFICHFSIDEMMRYLRDAIDGLLLFRNIPVHILRESMLRCEGEGLQQSLFHGDDALSFRWRLCCHMPCRHRQPHYCAAVAITLARFIDPILTRATCAMPLLSRYRCRARRRHYACCPPMNIAAHFHKGCCRRQFFLPLCHY